MTKKFLIISAQTIIVSVLINVAILVIARATTGAPATFGPFMYSPVIILTILGVIGASIVYALIKKYSQNPSRLFKIVSYVALVLSFIPDIQLPYSTDADNVGVTWVIVALLIVMHIVTALIVIRNFTKKA